MPALTFLWPYAVFLIVALIPIAICSQYITIQQAYLRTNLISNMSNIKLKKNTQLGFKWPHWLFILIWTLMTLAAMRPQFVGKPIEIARSGRNIFLTLDISESMEQEDLVAGQPVNRLSVAKSVLDEFINHRKGDRLALVLFGSESFLHAPLSFDHNMIKHFLHEARIGFLGPKTAIGDAIGLSVKKLMEQPADQDRVMILLTDGQNNTGGLEPMQAAELAKEQKVKLYIVGLGASSMIVDGFFGRGQVNPSQDLDEAEPQLKKMAEMTGGAYFRAKDQKSLSAVYNAVDRLEPVIVDSQVILPKKELFYWPLGLAIGLMLLSQLFKIGANYASRRRSFS
jgi:Ca-activated chloride channel family protein